MQCNVLFAGVLVFDRDMLMPTIRKGIDWDAIQDKKQKTIAESKRREQELKKKRQLTITQGIRYY